MKVYEVSKGDVGIKRGRVMMAIEGEESLINTIESKMIDFGFDSTNCAECGDQDGDLIIFFMMNRDEVDGFRKTWKEAKKAV